MLKPYSRSCLHVKDLLNTTDQLQPDLHTQLVETIQNEDDDRFGISRQTEYDGIVKKDGVTVVDRSDLL